MADITMCLRTACPNAPTCWRVQAKWDEYMQSVCAFEYRLTKEGVECAYYIPTERSDANRKAKILR